MLNYPLTDFSLKELHIISKLIDNEITGRLTTIQLTEKYFEFGSSVRRDNISDASNGLPELREMHVRVLTAIDIVKQRETTNAN